MSYSKRKWKIWNYNCFSLFVKNSLIPPSDSTRDVLNIITRFQNSLMTPSIFHTLTNIICKWYTLKRKSSGTRLEKIVHFKEKLKQIITVTIFLKLWLLLLKLYWRKLSFRSKTLILCKNLDETPKKSWNFDGLNLFFYPYVFFGVEKSLHRPDWFLPLKWSSIVKNNSSPNKLLLTLITYQIFSLD